MLNRSEILKYINDDKMIDEYVDLSTQLQPNGFDITVKDISLYMGAGTVDFDNTNRELPKYSNITSHYTYHLQCGSYLIDYNEKFSIPNNLIALGYTRSTLLRCGAFIMSAVWDSGFHGYGQGMLSVSNNYGINIQKNARVLQLIFIEKKDDKSIYDGKYNEETKGICI